MVKPKQSREERLEKKRIAERLRNERIKKNPVLYEQRKARHRERYYKKKREGAIVPVAKMSARQQKILRQKSRISSNKYNAKKRILQEVQEVEKQANQSNPIKAAERSLNPPMQSSCGDFIAMDMRDSSKSLCNNAPAIETRDPLGDSSQSSCSNSPTTSPACSIKSRLRSSTKTYKKSNPSLKKVQANTFKFIPEPSTSKDFTDKQSNPSLKIIQAKSFDFFPDSSSSKVPADIDYSSPASPSSNFTDQTEQSLPASPLSGILHFESQEDPNSSKSFRPKSAKSLAEKFSTAEKNDPCVSSDISDNTPPSGLPVINEPNITATPIRKSPSKLALRRYKYKVNKEFKLLHQRIAILTAEKNKYQRQVIRMRQRNLNVVKDNTPLNSDSSQSTNGQASSVTTELETLQLSTLKAQIENAVKSFYEEDENSRLCPGKRDCITRNKIKMQKRYITDTLQNLHKKFCSSHAEYKISYSYFCKLRPFWVLVPDIKIRETCLCQIHENMNLLVTALKNNNLISENSPTKVLESLCCDATNAKCLSRSCLICKDKHLNYHEFDNSEECFYWSWKKVRSTFRSKSGEEKIGHRSEKLKVSSTRKNMIEEFEKLINPYMRHVSNIIEQTRYIKCMKNDLKENECLIHCDFSENYTTKYHREIQAVHFSGLSVTLHTSVLYYIKNGERITQSFCTISESKRHDAAAIWEHLIPILEFIQKEVPLISTLYFLSDSPSSQYRNKKLFFIISALHWFIPSVDIIEWNYSESGHGKGAPDGVGGVLKRTADQNVARGNDAGNLKSLLDQLKKNVQGVIIEVVQEAGIYEKDLLIPSNLPNFNGTMRVHQVTWNLKHKNKLAMRRLSCKDCAHQSVQCTHDKHIGFYELDLYHASQSASEQTNNEQIPKKPSNKRQCKKISKIKPKKQNKQSEACIQNPDRSDFSNKENEYTYNTQNKEREEKSMDEKTTQKERISVIDTEIHEFNSFWIDVPDKTDVENVMTPSITKKVFSMLELNDLKDKIDEEVIDSENDCIFD